MRILQLPLLRVCIIMVTWFFCIPVGGQHPDSEAPDLLDSITHVSESQRLEIIRPVRIREYFGFMDSLLAVHAPDAPYPLSEHLVVHANPWILDTLVASDYERLMQRDSFLYDQREWIVLPKGRKLILPDSATGHHINKKLRSLRLEVNIPEYKLRIYADTALLHTFPVRVGQNRIKYLEMSGRETDLRTKIGKGKIIRHERDPMFINPVDGKRFFSTKRDDGKRTLMPQIPWLETELAGVRNGQMIHPTTNPATLGKAYSNGCIGTSEAAAWIIYYHAPLETPIEIRYDLTPKGIKDSPAPLRDIYGWGSSY